MAPELKNLTLEEIIKKLWQASEDRRICRISLSDEPFPRVVHPYGVSQTSRKKIVLVCIQSAGFTKAGGKEGFRNLQLDRIREVEILEEVFIIEPNFDPSDSQYKDWVYHV